MLLKLLIGDAWRRRRAHQRRSKCCWPHRCTHVVNTSTSSPKYGKYCKVIGELILVDLVYVHFYSLQAHVHLNYQVIITSLSTTCLLISQPFTHGFCFNLVNFEALLRLELMIHLLQSDGVVDGQNCHQCNTSSTEKANNIGHVIDERVVDVFVADEKANNIGPIVCIGRTAC